MTLEAQIQSLIDGAPDLESLTSVMAIAPILQQVAATLPQLEYYICQSLQGEWVITSLRHRQQPNVEIKVIYAFTSVQDISFTSVQDISQIGELNSGGAVKISIVQLLFNFLAFPEIDRLIFFNNSPNLDRGREISRQDLETAIAKHLQPHISATLPPDIC
jgi:hypothetical protein